MSIRTKIFYLTLPAILVLLMAGEIIVRKSSSMASRPLKKDFMLFGCFDFLPIDHDQMDPELLWRCQDFRGTRYSKDKERVDLRVICLGDSVTQGHNPDMRAFPAEHSYPSRLEKILQARFPNKNIEVMNAGCGGYSSFQGSRYLKRLREYDPDIVISWFGLNDQVPAAFFQDKDQKAKPSIQKDRKAASSIQSAHPFFMSKLALLARNLFAFKSPRVSPEDYYQNCVEMIKVARQDGFKIVFLVPWLVDRRENRWDDWDLRDYRAKLAEIEEQYGYPVIDVGEGMKGCDLNSLFVDECHPSVQGNEKAAKIIFEELKARGILK